VQVPWARKEIQNGNKDYAADKSAAENSLAASDKEPDASDDKTEANKSNNSKVIEALITQRNSNIFSRPQPLSFYFIHTKRDNQF